MTRAAAMSAPDSTALMAEFDDADDAGRRPRTAPRAPGYRTMDAYTPFPIEELAEALGFHHSPLPLLVLLGGIARRASAATASQYWASVDRLPDEHRRPAAPQLAGVHPDHLRDARSSCAALTAVLGMLALNGLPEPYHPVFNVPRFALASRDRFFLCIEATDPKFDRDGDAALPREPRAASSVAEVEH